MFAKTKPGSLEFDDDEIHSKKVQRAILQRLKTGGHQKKEKPFMIDLIPAFDWDVSEEEASSYDCSLIGNPSSVLGEIVVVGRDRSNSDTALPKPSQIRLFAKMPGLKFLTERQELKELSLERAYAWS